MSKHISKAAAAQGTVTVIGLGEMGRALAGAFLANGHPTTVWNRSAAKADDLVARGATRAASVAEAVAASELVVVCVLDYDVVRELLEPVDLSGRVLVNLATSTPEQSRETAEWAAGRSVEYLDGGIMGIPPMIGQPDAFVFYSGSSAAFETHAATLASLGSPEYLGTDPTLAAVYDVALLVQMYASWIGALYSYALAGASGVDATALLPYGNRWAAVLAPLGTLTAQQADARSYPDPGASLGMQASAIGNLIVSAKGQGIDTGLLDLVKSLADRGVAEGRGAEGFASVIESIRKPSA